MENKYKVGLYILLLSLVIFATLLFLIFSPYMARFKPVMKLRDKYVSVVFNIRKVFGYKEADFCWYLKNPISPLRRNDDGSYNYALVGKLVEVGEINSTITLECSNKKRYMLFTTISATNDPDWIKIDVGVNTKAEKPRESPMLIYKPDLSLSWQRDAYFDENQLYMAIWNDDRELTEINKDISSSAFVNTVDNYILSLLRY